MRRSEDIQADLGRAVLLIRGGHATSRRVLAGQLNLSPTTVGDYVEHLIDLGYVQETGVEKAGPGRPRRSLATLRSAGWFAGVEFNAERVQAIRMDFAGAVADTVVDRLPAGATAHMILHAVMRAIKHVGRAATSPLLALGIGAPGVVDLHRGVGREYAFVKDWHNVPVADTLVRRYRVPVLVENNLRAIASAERWLGGGRNLADFVILGPRHGFGIAIVSGGRVHTGSHHAAGEVGHWPCRRQQLQDALSAPAVWRRLTNSATGKKPPAVLRDALAAAAARYPRRLLNVIDDFADTVGRLHLLLDAEAYFLHGPLTVLGATFCDAISRRTVRILPAVADRIPTIRPSQLGDDAGAIGAGCLAMERWAPAAP